MRSPRRRWSSTAGVTTRRPPPVRTRSHIARSGDEPLSAALVEKQKLNPPPPDPVQAKMMQIMPIVFTGFFAFFPAGLVLYWLTNSVLSIAQQWRINKVLGVD